MKLAAAGLNPRFPVIADVGTLEMPDFARITYVPAAPRFTGAGPKPAPVPVPAPGLVGERSLGAVLVLHPATKATRSSALNQIPRCVKFCSLFIWGSFTSTYACVSVQRIGNPSWSSLLTTTCSRGLPADIRRQDERRLND